MGRVKKLQQGEGSTTDATEAIQESTAANEELVGALAEAVEAGGNLPGTSTSGSTVPTSATDVVTGGVAEGVKTVLKEADKHIE